MASPPSVIVLISDLLYDLVGTDLTSGRRRGEYILDRSLLVLLLYLLLLLLLRLRLVLIL